MGQLTAYPDLVARIELFTTSLFDITKEGGGSDVFKKLAYFGATARSNFKNKFLKIFLFFSI